MGIFHITTFVRWISVEVQDAAAHSLVRHPWEDLEGSILRPEIPVHNFRVVSSMK